MKARAPAVQKNVTHSLFSCLGKKINCPKKKLYFVPINEANEDGEFLARIHLRKIAQLQSRRKNWSFSGAKKEMEKTLWKLKFGENPQNAKSFCTAASVFNCFFFLKEDIRAYLWGGEEGRGRFWAPFEYLWVETIISLLNRFLV